MLASLSKSCPRSTHLNKNMSLLACATLISLVSLLLIGAARADDYSQWAHGKDLYLNTSPDGAYVTSTVRSFPLLVRLNAANFTFADAQGKGQDIRFAEPDGKHLPYEIERWDSAAAVADIWVKIDSVRGNANDQTFKMLWGKADAADSSNGGGVFDSANGYVSVWHLGGAGTGARPNSVAGGNPAVPVNYDGDENTQGIIGMADSLDGGAANGDYLNLGDVNADFSNGFTYSVWANSVDQAFWARFVDIGNGPNADNLVLMRHVTGNDLDFDHFNGTVRGNTTTAHNVLVTNQWQFIAITVSGKTANLYVNGVLAGTQTFNDTLTSVKRTMNYIGRSNWASNDFFKGKMDEAILAKTGRSADWMKLCYANQQANQVLVVFDKSNNQCQSAFGAPADTSLPEASSMDLHGIADCASGYDWSVVSGPAPRILDPEVKDLHVALPRVIKDVVIRYRFTARYNDKAVTKDVNVTVKEAIPEPTFTLPATFAWNGKDSLLIKPTVTNLTKLKTIPDSVINYAWTLEGLAADTAWRTGALLLKSSADAGVLKVTVCLDNNGPAVCKSTSVTVGTASSIFPFAQAIRHPSEAAWDPSGRRVSLGASTGDRVPVPLFFKP